MTKARPEASVGDLNRTDFETRIHFTYWASRTPAERSCFVSEKEVPKNTPNTNFLIWLMFIRGRIEQRYVELLVSLRKSTGLIVLSPANPPFPLP